jgi:3D (Asp-Asp-Asp) domain-containing protein
VILFLVIFLLTACQPPDAPPQPATRPPRPQAWQVRLLSPAGERLFLSSRPTVGEALQEIGLDLSEGDFIWPPPGTPLTANVTVEYRPARPILVRVDRQELTRTANGETVGQALASAGIALAGLDFSLPPESDPLPGDGVIQVVRVREGLALLQKTIPFQTQYVDAPETPLGIEEILAPGRPGVRITRTRIRYQDGIETGRFEEGEAVVQPAQDRLSGRGTKITLQPVPGQENLQFWRAISMYATSYSPCRSGVPGRCFSGTALGLPVRRGVVAMSRAWFNQLSGAQVYIPGYGLAVVADVGGGFPDGRPWVDLGFSDDDFETWGGWVTVYFLAPAPASIPYFLK